MFGLLECSEETVSGDEGDNIFTHVKQCRLYDRNFITCKIVCIDLVVPHSGNSEVRVSLALDQHVFLIFVKVASKTTVHVYKLKSDQ